MERPKQAPPNCPGFNVTWHPRGGWTIRVNGKRVYLGRDKAKAQNKFDDVLANLRTGREAGDSQPTVGRLMVQFMQFQEQRRDAGEITRKSHDEYKRGCKAVLDAVGQQVPLVDLTPNRLRAVRAVVDQLPSPHSRERRYKAIRTVFRSAYDEFGLVPAPIRVGSSLDIPSAKEFREHERDKGEVHLELADVAKLWESSNTTWRAFVALGYFCGMSQKDLAELNESEISLDAEDVFVESYRSKTGEQRLAYLPPIATEVIRQYIAERGRTSSKRLFITMFGEPYTPGGIGATSRTKFDEAGLQSPKSFYSLRRTTNTVGDELGDARALKLTVGHNTGKGGIQLSGGDMQGLYVRRVSRDRIKRIGEHLASELEAAIAAYRSENE